MPEWQKILRTTDLFQIMSGLSYKIIFSDAASIDLSDIQTYTELTFGKAQKELYQQKLNRGFLSIQNMPTIGHNHPLIADNLRLLNIEKHVVIYKIIEEKNPLLYISFLSINISTN